MKRHFIKILFSSAIFAVHSPAPLAACDEISSQAVQPLEFGLMRYESGFTRGIASVWPNGFVQMPRGLSLSSSSSAHPAIIRLTNARASEIAFRIDTDIIEGKDFGYLSNMRVSVIGADFEYDGTILRVRSSNELLAPDINATILLGGDLEISFLNMRYGKFSAAIKIRCLYKI
jgi:hypothetical protein